MRLPSLGQQVAALVAPVVHGDQAALVGAGAAVVGIDGSRPGLSSAADTSQGPLLGGLQPLSADLLGRVGTATQLAALAFDTGPRPASLGSTYLVSSDRVLRGWTLELFLVALLIPPIFALIDAAARARARGARPSITARRVLWRAGGLAVGVLAIRILGATGVLPDTHSPPFAGHGGGVSLWQVVFPLALGGACGALAARRLPADDDTVGAGRYLGAHASLLAGAALAFAGNAYLLVLVIPALHLWLLLPATARLGAAARAAVVLTGWLGPAAVIALLAGPGGLGVDAPAWFVRLIGDGGIPLAASAALAILASATIELLWLVVAAGGGTRTGDSAAPLAGVAWSQMRTLARRLGTTLAVSGVLLVVYAAMVVFWRDPVTSIYTAYEQHEMSSQLGDTFVTWQNDARKELGVKPATTGTHGGATVSPTADSASVLRSARRLAVKFAAEERGHTGRPLGRIRISRIGLSTIVVENTDYWGSLSKGPGRYEEGSFPASGRPRASRATARPGRRPSATSTASATATRSCSRCRTARSPTGSCGTGSSTTATGRS